MIFTWGFKREIAAAYKKGVQVGCNHRDEDKRPRGLVPSHDSPRGRWDAARVAEMRGREDGREGNVDFPFPTDLWLECRRIAEL